jgi:hypothetical protein
VLALAYAISFIVTTSRRTLPLHDRWARTEVVGWLRAGPTSSRAQNSNGVEQQSNACVECVQWPRILHRGVGSTSNGSECKREIADALKRDVEFLATQIGPRNLHHYAALTQSAEYFMRTSLHHQSEARPPNGPLTALGSFAIDHQLRILWELARAGPPFLASRSPAVLAV